MDQRHVDREDAPVEEAGDLAQEDGGEVRPSLVDGLADVRADEHGVVPEVALHLGDGVGGLADGEEVDDLHVLEFEVPLAHRVDEHLGDGASRVHVDALPG